jgi:transcriptional regulator GlxA family with amidase domain
MLNRSRTLIVVAAFVGCTTTRDREVASTARSTASTPAPALPRPRRPERIPVAFVVTHDAEVVDFAGPWGVFEYAAVPGYTDPAFQLYVVSDGLAPVKASGGMRIVPDYTFCARPHVRSVSIRPRATATTGTRMRCSTRSRAAASPDSRRAWRLRSLASAAR